MLLPQLELGLQPQLKLEPIVLRLIQIALQFKWQLHLLERLLLGLQVLVLRLDSDLLLCSFLRSLSRCLFSSWCLSSRLLCISLSLGICLNLSHLIWSKLLFTGSCISLRSSLCGLGSGAICRCLLSWCLFRRCRLCLFSLCRCLIVRDTSFKGLNINFSVSTLGFLFTLSLWNLGQIQRLTLLLEFVFKDALRLRFWLLSNLLILSTKYHGIQLNSSRVDRSIGGFKVVGRVQKCHNNKRFVYDTMPLLSLH